jgi:hypothetical protein
MSQTLRQNQTLIVGKIHAEFPSAPEGARNDYSNRSAETLRHPKTLIRSAALTKPADLSQRWRDSIPGQLIFAALRCATRQLIVFEEYRLNRIFRSVWRFGPNPGSLATRGLP